MSFLIIFIYIYIKIGLYFRIYIMVYLMKMRWERGVFYFSIYDKVEWYIKIECDRKILLEF